MAALPQSSKNIIKAQLEAYDLGSLVTPLIRFLEQEGYEQAGQEMLLGWLEGQWQFHQRFPALKMMRARDMPVSVQDILEYEKDAYQVLNRWGLDDTKVSPTQIQTLMAEAVSSAELNDRFQEGYARVANAPPEVRTYFQKHFMHGQWVLANVFLMPYEDTEQLLAEAEQAEIAGRAAAEGFENIDRQFMDNWMGQGSAERYSMDEVEEGIQSMARLRSLAQVLGSEDMGIDYDAWEDTSIRRGIGNPYGTPFTHSSDWGNYWYEKYGVRAQWVPAKGNYGGPDSPKWAEPGYWRWVDEQGNVVDRPGSVPRMFPDHVNRSTQKMFDEGYELKYNGNQPYFELTSSKGTFRNREQVLLAASFGDGDAQRMIDRIVNRRVAGATGSSGTYVGQEGSSLGAAE